MYGNEWPCLMLWRRANVGRSLLRLWWLQTYDRNHRTSNDKWAARLNWAPVMAVTGLHASRPKAKNAENLPSVHAMASSTAIVSIF
jgi:hypothetical protein